MYRLTDLQERDDRPREDHFVRFYGVTWEDYQRVLAMRGDKSGPRITYLEGTLEIMAPSRNHEQLKSLIGCLVEAYCLERDIPFMPVGSWTIEDESVERGAEPDECYLIGDFSPALSRPHLAIEVVWTSGGLDKLKVYQKLGVGEVWNFEKGRLTVHVLRDDEYVTVERSEVLPGLDLELLIQFLDRETAYEAIRDFRAALAEQS